MKGDKPMIKLRNLLCVKQKDKLDLGRLLLYEPYKNILQNFVDLATKIEAKDFDPVAKVYHGIISAPSEIRNYYESLLGITSYYQASKGGRGRYIEKKIASSVSTCSLDIDLSELPIWLEYPEIHRKKGIFTLKGLNSQEKRIFRITPWDWIGDRSESTDVGNILTSEKTIVLMEVKNRVDSGGTSARREILTSQKFGIIIDHLLSNKKLYKKENKKFSLPELLGLFGIENLELYMGILFDIGDKPATLKSDKQNGFYSSSKEGFKFLRDKIKLSNSAKIKSENLEKLQMEIFLPDTKLTIKIEALYGNDITHRLFRKELPVSDLLLLKYDDMWLSQLLAIDERTLLLKNNKNYSLIFKDLVKRDGQLRVKYDELISSECSEMKLNEIITYLFQKHSSLFTENLLPKGKDKEEYLADIVQFLADSDA